MVFKKHISLLIALLVLVSNSGLAFNIHYCEGKIASISSVFSNEEACFTSDSEQAKQKPIAVQKTCCAKIEKTHKECCSDKKVDLKNKTEKIIIKTISFDFEAAYFTIYNTPTFSTTGIQTNTDENVAFYCEANAPPLYKLYCQLTFYA